MTKKDGILSHLCRQGHSGLVISFGILIVLLIIRTLHGHYVAAIIQYPSEFEVQTQHELTEHL